MKDNKKKSFKTGKNKEFIIDALNMPYRELNSLIKEIIHKNASPKVSGDSSDNICKNGISIILENVTGQRYIGDGISDKAKIKITGVPGNDMGVFMDGPEIEVFGNVQDGTANTMNSGKVIIHGSSGDILGYSMRGGEIYVRDNVGWRSGIHMKSYLDKFPVIVIGGRAGNFLGEYMAGGIIIVLGNFFSYDNNRCGSTYINTDKTNKNSYYFEKFYPSIDKSAVGDFIGIGMHGGTIFLRGNVSNRQVGKEVKKNPLDGKDIEILKYYIKNFCSYFKVDYADIASSKFKDFIKLVPYSHRPYGKLYTY